LKGGEGGRRFASDIPQLRIGGDIESAFGLLLLFKGKRPTGREEDGREGFSGHRGGG